MLEVWGKAIEILRSRLDPVQFETWLGTIRPSSLADGTLTLEVPDEFAARWINDNYLELIKDALWDTARRHVGIDFKVRATPAQASAQALAAPVVDDAALAATPVDVSGRLVPRFTLDKFIVGPSNEVAFSACELVVGAPGRSYNPLFIYGGVGLGKTHLLHGVAHAINARHPGLRVLYMSGESYVNEVMIAVKNQRLDALRWRYRGQCDVLLMDDIQYLATREFAQEEFFHTFNELYNAQKQVVITSDQVPTSIPKISERLRSRFEWGLIVDVAPPEAEMRMRILRQKAHHEGISLPDDVAGFLADRFVTSVRELEGALNRVVAHALIRKLPLTVDLATRVSERILTDRRGRLTADVVLKTVADYFQLQVADIRSPRRHRGVSLPRQISALLLRRHTGASLPAIGAVLGGRSHTTILSALRHIEGMLTEEPATERAVRDIERQLGL